MGTFIVKGAHKYSTHEHTEHTERQPAGL